MTRFTITDRAAPKREARPGVRAVAEQVASEAAADTPVDTGLLQRSWSVEPRGDDWVIVNPIPYVWFVEFGQGPGRRRAVAMLGRALARAQARYG